MSTLAVLPRDEVFIEHSQDRPLGELYNRGWAPEQRRDCRVWTRKCGERGHSDITGQIDRVVVSRDTIHIESGKTRIQAKANGERGRGMLVGQVEKVTIQH